ncbi:unnamed protein product [Allacma fusca]|uniref:Uncharacterized protein n=1 Tax=Allacma fusca TaxID=39272 RepID=A0A8J2Q2N7_9HEXA|nr:unnamed protein product [Allacma fusca]
MNFDGFRLNAENLRCSNDSKCDCLSLIPRYDYKAQGKICEASKGALCEFTMKNVWNNDALTTSNATCTKPCKDWKINTVSNFHITLCDDDGTATAPGPGPGQGSGSSENSSPLTSVVPSCLTFLTVTLLSTAPTIRYVVQQHFETIIDVTLILSSVII